MVTAGVFLVVRCSPIFEYSQFTLNVITYVGLITSLFALLWLLYKNKKVIAYSTCSQLGYMFFACGSAYSLAMFHLVTHAFLRHYFFGGVVLFIAYTMNRTVIEWVGCIKSYQ